MYGAVYKVDPIFYAKPFSINFAPFAVIRLRLKFVEKMDLDGAKINGSVQSSEKKGEAYIKVEQSGVRRKLFQEDGTDGNDAYQDFVAMSICDQGTQMCQRNWNREFKADVKRDNQIFDKERKVEILQ